MKNIFFKKIISILLCTSIVFSFYMPIMAKETNKEKFDRLVLEISQVKEKIEENNNNIKETQDRLDEAIISYNLQYQIAKNRIKYMYEKSNKSIITELLESENLADLNNRIEFFDKVSSYGNDILIELRSSKEKIERFKSKLQKNSKKLNKQKEELESLKKEVEEAIKKEEEEKRQEMLAKLSNMGVNLNSNEVNVKTTQTSTLPYVPTEAEIKFMAAVLEAEAGATNYNANLAVATVICNRIASPLYPNTIYEVLIQPSQFSTVPGFANRILNQGISDTSLKAAKDAVAGARVGGLEGCIGFWAAWYAAQKGRSGVNIGGNVFF